MRLGDPGVQLLDADGDGRADLMVTTGRDVGLLPAELRGPLGRALVPAVSRGRRASTSRIREVRLVDLDGDGVTDAIRSGTRLECFFNEPDEGWNETRVVERSALPGLPGRRFLRSARAAGPT